MVKIREAIVVEGRYDKNTLSQIIDAPIFQTNGFGIIKDKAQLELLRLRNTCPAFAEPPHGHSSRTADPGTTPAVCRA